MQSGTQFHGSEMSCILFGQIRTVKLRDSARIVQGADFHRLQLTRWLPQVCARNAHLCEISKVGSNPVTFAFILNNGSERPCLPKRKPCQTLAIKRANGRAGLLNELRYLTASVALPPLLLRTVTLCGLTGHVNSPRNLPPPWFESVPISWLLEVTNTCMVVFVLLLVASTRSLRPPASYSPRVIATESGAGVACGVTVKPTLRVTPPELPLKVASVRAAT